MRVTYLGTSSGTPTRDRNVSGLALRFDDGRVWIVDCGEGTQHQILRSDLRPGRIEAIFLTHLHGDHCYGLPGLLASIAVHGRQGEAVQVIGPRGVAEWLAVTRRISGLGLGFPLRVQEVPAAGGELPALADCRLEAVPVPHRIESFVYLLEEAARPGRFDAERAAVLGVSGPDCGRLVRGETVSLADGRRVEPAELLGPDRPGRRLALFGDTSDSRHLGERCRGFDFVSHECTYAAELAEKARDWGHSTTDTVAAFARVAQPRQLALTHFSSRYGLDDDAPGPESLARAVQEQCPQTRVIAAADLQHIEVPFPEQALSAPDSADTSKSPGH